jgi:hypothetical protein
MTIYRLTDNAPVNVRNNGDRRECALALHFGARWTRHDSRPYYAGSDIELDNGMNISVKASHFTLMDGKLCEGRDNLEDALNLYMERTHSNYVAYVSSDFTAYIMNLDEFGKFARLFCTMERESQKNGGLLKVRCRRESSKMLQWLEERAA